MFKTADRRILEAAKTTDERTVQAALDQTLNCNTDGVQVEMCRPFFRSDVPNQPIGLNYVWTFRFSVENQRSQPIRINETLWLSTNLLGQTKPFRMRGIMGKRLWLYPGKSF